MADHGHGNKTTRRYGFACAPCKSRKIKCAGDRPVCAGCRRTGDTCKWPAKADSQRQTQNPRANGQLSPQRQLSTQGSDGRPHTSRADSSVALSLTDASVSSRAAAALRRERASSMASPVAPLSARVLGTSPGSSTADASLWSQTGIGEDGTVTYNGPTSRFHARPVPGEQELDAESDEDLQAPGTVTGSERTRVTSPRSLQASSQQSSDHLSGTIAALQSQYSLMDAAYTPLIAAKPSMNGTGVDTSVGIHLLDIYWTWLHPLHHVVYRPVFLMDLALNGPHCSDFLLLCIFGLAARHLRADEDEAAENPCEGRNGSEVYVQRAKALLLEEMSASSPSIPTIQGLLILGGRQCAIGRSSEGFLYTGMAIRMMQDVGLHLDTSRLPGNLNRWTPAEVEMRKRLYNSAYVWDKTISLALGRPPSLIGRPYQEDEILDKCEDQRLWHPVHAKEVQPSFQPSPSLVTSTLCAFSSLHEITTQMMLLFGRNPRAGTLTAQVQELDTRLCVWYEKLSSGLRVDDPSRLEHSPPPHIVSLNLLYNTLHILLRRPILGASSPRVRGEHLTRCVEHAKAIHAIYTLYAQTFPHRLMTYQVSYCIYTAATVEALELKSVYLLPSEQTQAASRLMAALKILQNEASHTPGSGKSLDTIRRILGESHQSTVHSRGRNSAPRKRTRFNSNFGGTTAHEDTFHHMSQARRRRDNGADDDEQMENLAAAPLPTTLPRGHMNESNDTTFSDRQIWEHDSSTSAAASCDDRQAYLGMAEEPSVTSVGASDLSGGMNGLENGWNTELGLFWNTETGAGFHPDAFSWPFTNEFP